MAKPLVSILLPCLNARHFLEQRIASLLAQTITDWEAIVLDSHSNDGSWEYFQSIAVSDARFQIHQLPREGLYAALNRGFELARGDFVHIATCDDVMSPEFLSEMLGAFRHRPQAGIAACDVLHIDRFGARLSPTDPEFGGRLSPMAIRDLLGFTEVRTAFQGQSATSLNVRPVPHDCLLHFAGRSVYFSLHQLIFRKELILAAEPFETSVGSIADFTWLLRVTKTNETVHLPKKLAMWRYHGDQLSIYRDDSRLISMKRMAERILGEIGQGDSTPLSANDRAALMLPFDTLLAHSFVQRVLFWCKAAGRLTRMILERPQPTFRALCRARFRFGTRRHSLVPMILEGLELRPQRISRNADGDAERQLIDPRPA